jgi:branched-subunit amino acid ABC-type transport system permease component
LARLAEPLDIDETAGTGPRKSPPAAGASKVVPYVALVLILLLRPYGLFGQPRIERV